MQITSLKCGMDKVMVVGDISPLAHEAMAVLNMMGQATIMAVLVIGVHFKKQGKIKLHGKTMLLAWTANIFFIFVHMEPSLQGDVGAEIVQNPLGPVSLLGLTHTGLGTVAMVLAGWIAVIWASGWSVRPSCLGKRRYMRATYMLWISALTVGVLLYIFHWFIFPG